MSDLAGKAHQGVIALFAVVGNASPPVTPTGAPRKWTIGSVRGLSSGRRVT